MIGLQRGKVLLCAHSAEWEAMAESLILRPGRIFGPAQYTGCKNRLIAEFIEAAKNEQ